MPTLGTLSASPPPQRGAHIPMCRRVRCSPAATLLQRTHKGVSSGFSGHSQLAMRNSTHIIPQNSSAVEEARWQRTGALTRAAAMARLSLDQRPVAHFLHIGKTAGTAVIVALKQSQDTAKYRLVRQPHHDRTARRTGDRSLLLLCARSDRPLRQWLSRTERCRANRDSHSLERGGSQGLRAIPLTGCSGRFAECGRHRATGRRSSDASNSTRAVLVLGMVQGSRLLQEQGGPHPLDRAPRVSGPEAARRGARPGEVGTADRPPASEQVRRPEARAVRSCPTEPSGMVRQGLSVSRTLRRVRSGARLARFGRPRTGRTFVGRAMSERPFALHNADALRLARMARRGRHRFAAGCSSHRRSYDIVEPPRLSS